VAAVAHVSRRAPGGQRGREYISLTSGEGIHE
jgi:hypothetical protein